jgi:hypothetical protein
MSAGSTPARPAGDRGDRGVVEKPTERTVAELGLTQDEDQHRRVPATLAALHR